MSTPAISVAMSVYNSERFLAEAIERARARPCEISSSSSSTTVRPIRAARSSSAMPLATRIRPISAKTAGSSPALNQLLEEARAPLVARMDADDVCLPEQLARPAAFLDAHPDYGVVGCWTVDIGENGANGPEASGLSSIR